VRREDAKPDRRVRCGEPRRVAARASRVILRGFPDQWTARAIDCRLRATAHQSQGRPSAIGRSGREAPRIQVQGETVSVSAQLDDEPAACQSRSVKSCGPLGSQDLAFSEDRPPPSQGGDLPQWVAGHGRRPAYHLTLTATGGSRWQRISLVSAVSALGRFAADCRWLRPRGSIKAPSALVWQRRRAGRASSPFAVLAWDSAHFPPTIRLSP